MKNPSILFVCTANIVRSPMAEALFRAYLQRNRPEDWRHWRVESAGTWAMDGDGIAQYSQAALIRRGLSLEHHTSRTVTAGLLSQFDLILTMESGQKEAIQVEFPQVAARVFLLSEMSGVISPVKDPYGKSPEAYEAAAVTIERLIEKGFDQILQRVLIEGS